MLLPSAPEAGTSNNGLWKATANQKKNTPTSGAVRLRTAGMQSSMPGTYTCAFTSGGGDFEYTSPEGTDDKNFVRPAIHLNLTEIAGLSVEDYSTVYDGSGKDVSSAPFYDSEMFSSTNMKIEYFNSTGTQNVVPKDVGTYKIKFTLLNKDDYEWADGDTTNDVRWIDYEITQRPVRVNFVTHPNDPPDVSLNEEDLCGTDKTNAANLLVVTYESTDGGGYKDTTPAQKRGKYSATVSINNPNYKTDKTYYTEYEQLAIRLKLPTFNKTTSVYNKTTQTFTLDYNSKVLQASKPTTPPAGYNTKAFTQTMQFVKASQAGKYAIQVHIIDPDNYVWDEDDTVEDKFVEFEITAAPYTLNFQTDTVDGSTIACEFEQNKTVTICLLYKYKAD